MSYGDAIKVLFLVHERLQTIEKPVLPPERSVAKMETKNDNQTEPLLLNPGSEISPQICCHVLRAEERPQNLLVPNKKEKRK
jgi:hypothetical protein